MPEFLIFVSHYILLSVPSYFYLLKKNLIFPYFQPLFNIINIYYLHIIQKLLSVVSSMSPLFCKKIQTSIIPTTPICPEIFPVIDLEKYVSMYPACIKVNFCLFPGKSQYNYFIGDFLSYWKRIRMNLFNLLLIGDKGDR